MVSFKDMKISCCKLPSSIPVLITLEYTKSDISPIIEWGSSTLLEVKDRTGLAVQFSSVNAICRFLARISSGKLYGDTILQKTEIDHWVEFSALKYSGEDFSSSLEKLNKSLLSETFLVGQHITLADICIWSMLMSSKQWQAIFQKGVAPKNVSRWFNYLSSLPEFVTTIKLCPVDSTQHKRTEKSQLPPLEQPGKTADKGKFVELPGAEMGKVVVRFPPEASGFLHIGHAKAALLNSYYQTSFNGKLIMRFDDTNPEKEKEDFEKVILEDVSMLEIKPDIFTYTSDCFDLILGKCEELLRKGVAYVDDTDPDTMKKEREQKIESKNRNNSPEKNLSMWEQMKNGTEYGTRCCVRAKIDMNSDNGCLRDPTMYRCKAVPHPRTGSNFKVYPTYDFACPIVDSVEGVTHALRTTEYHDRDEQYFWFLDSMELRKPHIYEYSRLNMMNTVLSKRKLTWFVEQGIVDGWDDPRMPTVRGVLRRGMTVEGLKQFIVAQGSSRSVVMMEWDKIWAFNRKVIDPVAHRYNAVESEKAVPVFIEGASSQTLCVSKHPKDPSLGTRQVHVGSKIIVDQVDAKAMHIGENVTFINWGNLLIKEIFKNEAGDITKVDAKLNLENKDFKKTLKVTWVADLDNPSLIPCVCIYYDHIISKPVLGKDDDFKTYVNENTKISVSMLGDPDLASLKKGDIIQLQRKGFFICDTPYDDSSMRHTSREMPLVLISIPDGSKDTTSLPSAVKMAREKGESPKELAQSSKGKASEKSPQDEERQFGRTEVESVASVNEQIKLQGDKVRKLKAEKVAKAALGPEIQCLLDLKSRYKELTGNEWQPNEQKSHEVQIMASKGESDSVLSSVDAQIVKQGDKIRKMKADKVAKVVLDPEIKCLLELKSKYKELSGKEWQSKPTVEQAVPKAEVVAEDPSTLDAQIREQGDKIRRMKGDKVAKDVLDPEIKCLLSLKSKYKAVVGKDWSPANNASPDSNSSSSMPNETASVSEQIKQQGDKIRELKATKCAKDVLDPEVKRLLELKANFKALTGQDWQPPSAQATTNKKANQNSNKLQSKDSTISKKQEPSNKDKRKSNQQSDNKEVKPQDSKKLKEDTPETDSTQGGVKKITRLGLEARKEDNFSEWYSQAITKSEMLEYYDVSGCYILRPWAFGIWEAITNFFDPAIKALGVSNCYFPMFVSSHALEREKTHITDFAPEVAWVTKSGSSDLAEPVAIRPTSETVMYPSYAKWIRSHRDLPLQLNQWCSVVRWEFKHPQPFIRTREFLWQEGHTAFATREEAVKEVYTILDLYAKIYEDLLAIPVIRGRKTEKEKFAGADFTTTIEAYVPTNGRAIQGATSHHLGQNFSKMFEIVFEHPETGEKEFVYQNSWGLSTRTIGVSVMVHGDNSGLVLPPRVAPHQVVIVPCGITASLSDSDKKLLMDTCEALENELRNASVKVKGDYRENYSPGWKFNHWELKGVPLRIELGPRDVSKGQFVAVRRDTGVKVTEKLEGSAYTVKRLLDDIHESLFRKAKNELDEHLVVSFDFTDFCSKLDNRCIIQAPFCGEIPCEDVIKKESARDADEILEPGAPSMGAKTLCIPFQQPGEIEFNMRCINPTCSNRPKYFTLFGRSY